MKNYRVIFAPDAEDDFDQYLISLYMLYRVEGDNVFVDAIGHERQDMEKTYALKRIDMGKGVHFVVVGTAASVP